MTTLEIIYGQEQETKRVEQTLSKLDWFKEKGYQVILPKTTVAEEYDETKYKVFTTELAGKWQEFANKFEAAKGVMSVPFRDKYTILLTRYGVGGSYDSGSGKVIVNIESKTLANFFVTVVHEMIHISIEHLIQKYKIEHWHKERLVDLIGNKLFPELKRQMQPITNVERVDKAFDNFFPDIEAITKEIGMSIG